MNSYTQADCVMLALDSAKKISGSSLIVTDLKKPGKIEIVHRCEIRRQADRELAMRHLYAQARARHLPPVIYAETWSPGRWGFKQILGMGEGWGMWKAAHENIATVYGEVLPEAPILRVLPQTWRSAFGLPLKGDTKGPAQNLVNALLGVYVQPDIAESLIIGLHGMHNAEVIEEVAKWLKRKARMSARS